VKPIRDALTLPVETTSHSVTGLELVKILRVLVPGFLFALMFSVNLTATDSVKLCLCLVHVSISLSSELLPLSCKGLTH